MARVLVTGGTGFIGRHFIRRLLERGDRVRCLIRSGEQTDPSAPLDVEYEKGDVTLPDTLDQPLRGIEVVYHLAGATLPVKSETYHLVNAEGTRHLAEACARQPLPPIFVYVSSLAAAGPAEEDQPLTEDSTPRPVSEYGRSKLAGERSLRALADRLPVTILRPPIVLGPGDRYVVRLFRLTRKGLNVVPGRRGFRLSWIYVNDLIEAMLLAAERGQRLAPVGQGPEEKGVYFVALDEQPTVYEAAELAAQVQGCRVRCTIHVPTFLCRLARHFNDLRTWVTGRAYWWNADRVVEALAGPWICSTEKAQRELGLTCRTSLADSFRLIFQWYRDQGWL